MATPGKRLSTKLEAAEKEGMPTPTADSDAEIVELEVAGP
jgi:hypothetical protein